MSLSTVTTANIHVVDPDGLVHVIPMDIVKLGLGVCEEHQDPFDPSYVPSTEAMAQAYIAMAYALRREGLRPRPESLGRERES